MNRHFLRTLPIASRMLATSLILVVLVIPVAGLLLSYNLREAVNTAFDERLASIRYSPDGIGRFPTMPPGF